MENHTVRQKVEAVFQKNMATRPFKQFNSVFGYNTSEFEDAKHILENDIAAMKLPDELIEDYVVCSVVGFNKIHSKMGRA